MTFVESWRSMAESDHYLLGRGEAEEARLKRQIADLATPSFPQLPRCRLSHGARSSSFRIDEKKADRCSPKRD